MANEQDARFKKCEQRIQDALADLLARKPLTEIGVSELAREASVSRATFYAHYDNVGDVFGRLVQEALANVLTFGERFSCDGAGCKGAGKLPYCERVRAQGRLAGVIGDPQFFSTMMGLSQDDPEAGADAADLHLSRHAMRVVRLFQMSGCHAVATSGLAGRDDWERTRAIVDRFIEAGMEAVRGM